MAERVRRVSSVRNVSRTGMVARMSNGVTLTNDADDQSDPITDKRLLST
jgi:hypothetical protein